MAPRGEIGDRWDNGGLKGTDPASIRRSAFGQAGPPQLVVLWGAPRSRSTAFFRMMCERRDHVPIHEPFSYLAEFGRATIDNHIVQDEKELIMALRHLSKQRRVFVKDTTDERYPGLLADDTFLAREAVHTFLIRNPRDTIPSYHAINPDVRSDQVGTAHQFEIFMAVKRSIGRTPIVVDADDLVSDPPAVVRTYCQEVGIEYLDGAMQWMPTSRPEWMPTARWHLEVSRSSGFSRTEKTYRLDVDRHPKYRAYLAHHLPYYEAMYACRTTGA